LASVWHHTPLLSSPLLSLSLSPGTQAVMFVDLNELPFDDADIFEAHQWKPVEGKYPSQGFS